MNTNLKNEKQVLFDKMLTHLFKQGKPSIASDGKSCMYRGPNGTMCAVGCLISNKHYRENMEGNGAFSVVETYFTNSLENANFLNDAQYRLHDGFIDRDNRKDGFKRWLKREAKHFAAKWDLEFNFNHVRI